MYQQSNQSRFEFLLSRNLFAQEKFANGEEDNAIPSNGKRDSLVTGLVASDLVVDKKSQASLEESLQCTNEDKKSTGAMNKPITIKDTHRGSAQHLRFGVSAMQGWRTNMEDAHICQPIHSIAEGHSIFCVLDGHGGSEASEFASEEWTRLLLESEEWEKYTQLFSKSKSSTSKTGGNGTPKALKEQTQLLEKALTRSLIELDRELYITHYYGDKPGNSSAGSTLVAVLITPNTILCANVGDSRCVLATSGSSAPGSVTAHPLSEDHKPDLEDERQRIQQAGGRVTRLDGESRVDGELAVSRALGDFELKYLPSLLLDEYDPSDPDDVEQLIEGARKQKVCPVPEIRVHPRSNNIATDRFLVLACDGVWDVVSNQECVEWVVERMQHSDDLGIVCEQILDICLQQGSQDNMTIAVVLLEDGERLLGGASGMSALGRRKR